MSNALEAVFTSLTYKGTDLQRSDLTVHLDVTLGVDEPVEVRGEDTIVPALAGRIPRNRVGDRLVIELTGWVQGTGATEDLRLASFRNLSDELRLLFDPRDAPGTLAGTTWDGATREIEARSNGMRWGPHNVFGVRQLIVVMESVDPDWSGGS